MTDIISACLKERDIAREQTKIKEREKIRKGFKGPRLLYKKVRCCIECPYLSFSKSKPRRVCGMGVTPYEVKNPHEVPDWCPLPFAEVDLDVDSRQKLNLVSISCGQCPRVTRRKDDDCGIDLEVSCPVRHECGLPPSEAASDDTFE